MQSLKPKEEIRKASGELSWQRHKDVEVSEIFKGLRHIGGARCTAGI